MTYINVVAQRAAAEHGECLELVNSDRKKRWKCNKTICPVSDRSHLCANLRYCAIKIFPLMLLCQLQSDVMSRVNVDDFFARETTTSLRIFC